MPLSLWLLLAAAAMSHLLGWLAGWRACDRHHARLMRRQFAPWLKEGRR